MIKQISAFIQQSNSNSLDFLLTIFRISYLKNWKSFWPLVKSESWVLVSGIILYNMTCLWMLKNGNFHQSQENSKWCQKTQRIEGKKSHFFILFTFWLVPPICTKQHTIKPLNRPKHCHHMAEIMMDLWNRADYYVAPSRYNRC